MEPPQKENTIIGAVPAAAITPSISFDPVSPYTSHPSAVLSIHVPISETSWPQKKRRKFRCLSAVNTLRQPGRGATIEAGMGEVEGPA